MNKIRNGGKLTNGQVGFLLIVPGLAVFAAIILYPFVDAILMSFTNRSMLSPEYDVVGLTNYMKVFKDPYFVKTLITTFAFVLGSTILPFTLGLIWAIVLNQGFRGAEFLGGVTRVNWIIPGTAIGFLWSWIFNGQYGILNSVLEALGILETGIPWLGQTNTALLCVVIARTWQMLPWYMAFLLGGLQSISLEQVEAAHIDGANNWKTFWKIMLPGMKQTAILVFILGLIGNLQHSDAKNYYHYRLDVSKSTHTQLYWWVGGTPDQSLTKEYPAEVEKGRTYRLRVTSDGTEIKCYLDGVLTQTLGGCGKGGNVGVRLYNAKAL